MRIVLYNWARIWDGATIGGGVNGYTQSVALELTRRGHDVCYLFAGLTFTPRPDAWPITPGAPSVRRHADWMGIRVFELQNSSVMAPASNQFADPAGEISDSPTDLEVERFFRLLRPDVVHFHNIEGLTAASVAAVRRAAPACAIVYSLHNYHTICPQAYLMQGAKSPCRTSSGGRACATCITGPDPAAGRAELAAKYAQIFNFLPAGAPDPTTQPRAVSLPLYGEATPDGESLNASLLPAGADPRGQSAAILEELKPGTARPAHALELAPVDNTITPDPAEAAPANEYARRRAAMVDMLNSCDAVLAVSEFVRAKFESLGVNPAKLSTNHIGTRLSTLIERHGVREPEPPPIDAARPIRLVYMGHANFFKGLPMLADTLDTLPAAVLRRFHLHLFAQHVGWIERRFRRLSHLLADLTIKDGYEYHDIPWLLAGKDLGIVTSVWWDNAPQTVFEFQACGLPVLGANIGGIPDFVRHNENGLLFRANDRADLARALSEVAERPQILPILRAGVRPPKTMVTHGDELERLYTRLTDARAASPQLRKASQVS